MRNEEVHRSGTILDRKQEQEPLEVLQMWNRMHSDHFLPDSRMLLSQHEPVTRFSAGESSFHCLDYCCSYCCLCYDLTTVNRGAVGTDGDDGDAGWDDDRENWSKAHIDVVPDVDGDAAAGVEKTSDSLDQLRDWNVNEVLKMTKKRRRRKKKMTMIRSG